MAALEEIRYGNLTRPSEIAIAIGLKVASLIVVSVAYTMILLEGVKLSMVIGEYFRDKYVVPLQEKRRAEEARRKAEQERLIDKAVVTGISEAHQAWADWNRRRMEAEASGLTFDEAPPEFPQHTGESK